MRYGKGTLAGLAAVALVAGCAPPGEQGGEPRLLVAVSIQPQAWLIEQIGGPHVDVITLVEPGESPETYQPTDAKVSRVIRAAVYFRLGVPAEKGPWFQAVASAGGPRIVDLSKGIHLREMESHHHHDHDEAPRVHEAGGHDPHVWLSPRLLKIQAETAASALEEMDPAHAEDYRRNLAALAASLDETDAAIRKILEPLAGRAFLVFHPAWGYFADEYGLRQITIESEGKEPTDHEVTEIQELARAEAIKVVFVQPQIAGGSANAIAEAVGGRVETLDPLAADPPAEMLRTAEAIAKSYR